MSAKNTNQTTLQTMLTKPFLEETQTVSKPPEQNKEKESQPLTELPKIVSICAIILISCLNIGNFYIFDLPEELAEETKLKYDITQTQLNLMYTLYFAPSVFILIFSSKISSLLTSSLASLICSFFVFAGSLITTYGFEVENFRYILIGRFVFGFGGELLIVLGGCLMEEWFKGGKLTLASSLMEMLSLGAIALSNFVTLPTSRKYNSISIPYLIGSTVCVVCLILNIAFYFLDVYKAKKIKIFLKKLKFELKAVISSIDREEDDGEDENSEIRSKSKAENSFFSHVLSNSETLKLSSKKEFSESIFSSTFSSGFSGTLKFTLTSSDGEILIDKSRMSPLELKHENIKEKIEEMEVRKISFNFKFSRKLKNQKNQSL